MKYRQLVRELKARGIPTVNGRPLSKCLAEELESALNRWSEGDTLPHISNSQVETYLRCGRQWMYRYVHGLKLPPSGSMSTGSAVHTALAANYRQKKETGTDIAFDELEGRFEEDLASRKNETTWEDDLGFDVAKCYGSIALKDYHKAIAPQVQPQDVEEPVRMFVPGTDVELLMVLDLRDKDGLIIDHKTGKQGWSQGKVDTHLQLSLYSAYFGLPVQSVAIDNLVLSKNPYAKRLTSTRGPSDYAWAFAMVRQVYEGIRRGVFLPAEPGSWVCGPKFCGYYERCRKEMME